MVDTLVSNNVILSALVDTLVSNNAILSALVDTLVSNNVILSALVDTPVSNNVILSALVDTLVSNNVILSALVDTLLSKAIIEYYLLFDFLNLQYSICNIWNIITKSIKDVTLLEFVETLLSSTINWSVFDWILVFKLLILAVTLVCNSRITLGLFCKALASI